MTSSPGRGRAPRTARCSAAVPLDTATACAEAAIRRRRRPRTPSCAGPSSASPSAGSRATASRSSSSRIDVGERDVPAHRSASSQRGRRRGRAPPRSCPGYSGSVISRAGHVLGPRQRRRAEALAVGRELVHGGIEDARLHAARRAAWCARRRGGPRPRAGPASRNTWSARRPRRRRARSRRSRGAAARGSARVSSRRRSMPLGKLGQAREQQRRARLVEAVVEAQPDGVVGLRLRRCAGSRCPTSCPGCAARGRARRRRRRRWRAARPRRTRAPCWRRS